jgi:uncharacterized peroxidase-related enzyme
MSQPQSNNLPMIDENEAAGEVADIYDQVKREFQIPIVPNIMKALAASPVALKMFWSLVRLMEDLTLPQSLVAMITYTIATKNECEYCSVNNELTCRTLGVDEVTLAQLVEDLGNVKPERVRAIIEFALMVATHPKALTPDDYERLREQGVTDEEIVEIVMVAAVSVQGDILADTLKIEVEPMVKEALGRGDG